MNQEIAEKTEQQPLVLKDVQNEIITLTLNRPKQFNALSEAMLAALQTELDQIANDEQARVVVLKGAGKVFCAGHDLKEMIATRKETYYQSLFKQCGRLMMSINQMPQPVIAQVHGIATAAGCQLVAACDLAVAAEETRFATSGINVGLFCSTPAVPLSRNVSQKQAMEMLLTGEFIHAETAMNWGLINRIAPFEQLDSKVQELVDAIISKSSVAVSTGKKMFYKQLERNQDEAYAYAADIMACNMMAEDVSEGVDAFINKRHPVWKGK